MALLGKNPRILIRLRKKLLLFTFLMALFSVLQTETLRETAKLGRLNEQTLFSDTFRNHALTEEVIEQIREMDVSERGRAVGLYLLDPTLSPKESVLKKQVKIWKGRPAWNEYLTACEAVWNDVAYFPVPKSKRHSEYQVNYRDSWMSERTFGGKRGHEGTDIMASADRPGLYPIVSMTDGIVESKGWLTRGGWRLGIRSPSGGYYYYAHLESYAEIEEGDEVHAGDILGFMGNSGYGPEGTTGMFATHLHLGIYLYPDGIETSINPYWILRMIEEKKLSCSF